MTSPNLESYDTISNFSDNIIKQVPVTSDYGYMIVERLVSFADCLNCHNATFKPLEFHMRDGREGDMSICIITIFHLQFSSILNNYI